MTFRPPSFRAVVAFEAAARYENFARAAAELNLTQSAVSHAIRALEERFGEPLFRRHGRRVALTPDGAQLAQRIRASLALLASAFGDTAAQEGGARVVIGAPAEFTANVLMPRLSQAELLDSCELRTGLPVTALSQGAVDLVIARGPAAWPTLASRLLGGDTVFPVAAPGLSTRRGYPNLGDLPLIENTAHPWRLWLAQLQRADELPGLGLVVDGWGLAIAAAKAGAGVCLAPASLVADDLARGRLVRVGEAELAFEGGYHLVWDPRNARRAPVQAVIDVLVREPPAGEAAPSQPRPALKVMTASRTDMDRPVLRR